MFPGMVFQAMELQSVMMVLLKVAKPKRQQILRLILVVPLYISPDKNDDDIVTEEFCNNNPSICSYGSGSSGLKEPQITVLSSLKNLTINNHNDTFDKLTVVIADGVQIESG
ncbi:hypothetical protein P4S64_01345 [Vibrio sp. M60_M31a]